MIQQYIYRFISIIILLSMSQLAHAQVLVLVHGYLSSANTWHQSGVMPILQQAGWQDGGILQGTLYGVQILAPRIPQIKSNHIVYRANLPTLSSISLQADILATLLARVRQQHPLESLVLVGHSAGGLVARATLIRPHLVKIEALITLSSPHLGTRVAETALNIAQIPSPITTVFGFFSANKKLSALPQSKPVLRDLVRETPGTYLFWLNRQIHPDIFYYSVIHYGSDDLVPAYSQDLSRVFALSQQQVHLWAGEGKHELSPSDGQTILAILADIAK